MHEHRSLVTQQLNTYKAKQTESRSAKAMDELPPSYAAVERDPAAYGSASQAVLDADFFRIYYCQSCCKEFLWPAGMFKAVQAHHELVCAGRDDESILKLTAQRTMTSAPVNGTLKVTLVTAKSKGLCMVGDKEPTSIVPDCVQCEQVLEDGDIAERERAKQEQERVDAELARNLHLEEEKEAALQQRRQHEQNLVKAHDKTYIEAGNSWFIIDKLWLQVPLG